MTFTDPIMQQLYITVTQKAGVLEELNVAPPEKYFWKLCQSIIGQQLSEKVAPIIEARVEAVLKQKPTPETVLSTPDQDLRAAGLSFSKISYLKNVATAWQSGEIEPHLLHTLSDEEVINKLVTIKGVGRWTAEMFLIFTLARKDIFSAGDYGLRRAILLAYDLPTETKPQALSELATHWSPHRSLASRLLWKSLDVL